MEDTLDGLLRKDIESFLYPRVHDYLQKCIKRAKQGQRLFSPSHALSIIRAFEEEIEHLHSAQMAENDYQATLDLWKKTFTRNILVPKYLISDPHMDIEHVIHLMKNALHTACQEARTETYVRSLRQTIVNTLRSVPPLERLKRAKQILNSSLKVVEKLEKNFPTETVLKAINQENLEQLAKEAASPLQKPEVLSLEEGSHESRLIKKRVRHTKPLPDGLDKEKLKKFLRGHLHVLIDPSLQSASALLTKLQVVSQLLADIEKKKELITAWIDTWQDKPAVKTDLLISTSWSLLPEIILQIRGEVLSHSCLEEIHAARGNGTSQTYAKMREEILERYLRSYLHEPQLKDYFLQCLQEEERTERERFLPPADNLEPPTSKGPGKKSLWQRV